MPQNTVAKYQKIESYILERIKNGTLQPGDKVESESELKKRFHVSAITVRKAFSELINDGYLVGVQGSGTYVAKKQMIRGLTSISFSEELKQQGYHTSMKVDYIRSVHSEMAAEKLGLEKDAELTCAARVRLANEEPVAYQISWFSSDLFSVEEAEGIRRTSSLYETMKACDIVPVWVNENYSVRDITDPAIAKQMQVKKGSPSFFVRRTTFDSENNIIEYAETYFNKDFYSVTVNIKV